MSIRKIALLLASAFCLTIAAALLVVRAPDIAHATTDLGILYQSSYNGVNGLYWARLDGSERTLVISIAELEALSGVGVRGRLVLSPDGKRLAFNGGYPNINTYLLDLDTRQSTRVTRAFIDTFALDWSPDGTRLLLVQGSGHRGELSMVDLRSGEIAWTVRNTYGNEFNDARWSPDGTQIALASLVGSSQGSGRFAVLMLNPDGTALRPLTPGDLFTFTPAWDMQTGTLYYACPMDRWKLDAICQTDMQRGLSARAIDLNTLLARDESLRLADARDGRILFWHRAFFNEGSEVYLFDTMTRTVTDLTEGGIRGFNFRWSPRPVIQE